MEIGELVTSDTEETGAVSSGRLARGRLVHGLQATVDSGLTAKSKNEVTGAWEGDEGLGPPAHSAGTGLERGEVDAWSPLGGLCNDPARPA